MRKTLISITTLILHLIFVPAMAHANEQLYVQLQAARLLDVGDCFPYLYSQRRALDDVVADTFESLEISQSYEAGTIDRERFDAASAALNAEASAMATEAGCEGARAAELINQARGYAWQRALRNIFISEILFNLPEGHQTKLEFETIELNAMGALKGLIQREYGSRAEKISQFSAQQAQLYLRFLYVEDPDIKGRFRLAKATPEFEADNVENSLDATLVAHKFSSDVTLEWSMEKAGFFTRKASAASNQNGTILIPKEHRDQSWELLNKTSKVFVQTREGPARTNFVMANSPNKLSLFLYGLNYSQLFEGRATLLFKDGRSFSGHYRDCKDVHMACFDFDMAAKQAITVLEAREYGQVWLATKNAKSELQLPDYMLAKIFGPNGL
ncbi:hypothetical protein [Maritalea sp. S77]|uniref:hypothetical protein n=1 Tax=Maritalea sp. S77 TaxID=3415125 RepID=UPI003C7E8C56